MIRKYIKKKLDELDKRIYQATVNEWYENSDKIAYSLGWFIIIFNMLEETI